jgi:hypothetical protein
VARTQYPAEIWDQFYAAQRRSWPFVVPMIAALVLGGITRPSVKHFWRLATPRLADLACGYCMGLLASLLPRADGSSTPGTGVPSGEPTSLARPHSLRSYLHGHAADVRTVVDVRAVCAS